MYRCCRLMEVELDSVGHHDVGRRSGRRCVVRLAIVLDRLRLRRRRLVLRRWRLPALSRLAVPVRSRLRLCLAVLVLLAPAALLLWRRALIALDRRSYGPLRGVQRLLSTDPAPSDVEAEHDEEEEENDWK